MKSILRSGRPPLLESADNARRSFFWKMGAGVSGALASTTVMGSSATDDADGLSLQVAMLEEEKALRRLHQTFVQAMDQGLFEDVIEKFSDDAEVVFNGGVFRNRSQGVSRLFRDRFRAGKTGKTMEPAPGHEIGVDGQQDKVTVSSDCLSATAIFPYSIRVGVPIESDTSLASMARLHGDGVRTWWEGGNYRVAYEKDAVEGRWRIRRLEYDTLSRADYRPGRTCAGPISVAPIAACYPEDPQGPDRLV